MPMHDNQQNDQHTQWDFAAVDAARDPSTFVRYLQQCGDEAPVNVRRQLSYDLLSVQPGQHLLDVGCAAWEMMYERWRVL
jgi:hypothetical protein